MKYIWILLIMIALIPAAAAVNATEATIVYQKSFDGVAVTAVDTNTLGTIVFAGLANGSIIAMDDTGEVLWNVYVSDDVQKIVSDDMGNIVYLTGDPNNRIGYITSAGTSTWSASSSINISAIDNSHSSGDGWLLQVNTGISTGALYIRDGNGGAILYSNTSYGVANWTTAAYDDTNYLIVTANTTNNSIFLWNITNWTGWENFNPSHTPKNSTLEMLDSFPHRKNFTINNAATATVSIAFTPSTSPSVTNITQNTAAEFSYNRTNCGDYFLITNANNLSYSPQTNYLNWSLHNSTSHVLNMTFKKNSLVNNITIYYGNPTYTNRIVENNWTTSNMTLMFVNYTGSGTWTAPTGVTSVNVTVVGGGGGGAASKTGNVAADGGGRGNMTSGVVSVTAGTSYTVTVGSGGSGGVGDGDPGDTGGTSTFEGISAVGGPGGLAAFGASTTGASGNTSISGYPTASSGGNAAYWDTFFAACQYSTGGSGGAGFGSGGGGGGYVGTYGYAPGCSVYGSGGDGGGGVVQLSFYVVDVTKYMVGTAPTSYYFSPEMTEAISSSMNYVAYANLAGNIQSLSIPEGGGWVTVGTSGPNVYAQQISTTGFGTQYSGVAETGTSAQIAAADSASYYIEARSLGADIYQIDGTQVGHYSTGGLVNSVDISAMNGLYAIAGSADGKDYIFSKDTSSGWLVYYLSDTLAPVSSVAMSDHGEYAVSGRTSGIFTMYNLQSITASTVSFTADVFVHKGGAIYPGVNITITTPGSSNITGTTDADGKFTFTAVEQKYYTIIVGNNEYSSVYHASPNYKVITINVPNPLITTPYTYYAKYNSTSKKISYYYQDVDPANVNIKIYDATTKTTVLNTDYLGTTLINNNYTVTSENHTYKVTFSFTRSATGATYKDSININPGSGSFLNNIPAQYRLFATFIYIFIVIGGFALTITKTSIKPGLLVLVGLWNLGGYIGIIPFDWNNLALVALFGTINIICIAALFRRDD